MVFGNLCIFQRPFGIAGKRDQKNNCILGCFCEIFEIGIVKFVNHLGISKKLIQQSSHPESGTVGRACTNNEAFFGIAQMGNNLIHIFLIQMVYYHFELGGAIMQTAWYIAVPFNILVTVPLGLGFYELDNQFVKKLREVKHYIRAVV